MFEAYGTSRLGESQRDSTMLDSRVFACKEALQFLEDLDDGDENLSYCAVFSAKSDSRSEDSDNLNWLSTSHTCDGRVRKKKPLLRPIISYVEPNGSKGRQHFLHADRCTALAACTDSA